MYAELFKPMEDSFRTAMSDFFGLPEDTFGGSNAYRLGRFVVIKHGDTVQFASEDWGHTTASTLQHDFTIPLGGMKNGFDMKISFDLMMPSFHNISEASTNGAFVDMYTKVEYGPGKFVTKTGPIIELSDDVSSWEVGDEIVIGSTDFDQDGSETFIVQRCKSCAANQVLISPMPKQNHWGRVDQRTGADQRAEVGLLSRNVRITSELGERCQYAHTRDSLSGRVKYDGMYVDNPNYGRSWCDEFENRGFGDMHGGHTVVTWGFENVHITHVELHKLGQPSLAKYPLHWHMLGEVGHNAGYEGTVLNFS